MAARSSIRSAFVVAVAVFMACWCALDARAQSIVGWGSENFRNVDNLDGNIVKDAIRFPCVRMRRPPNRGRFVSESRS